MWQELDVSWNRLGDIPLDPPQLVNSSLDRDRSVEVWAPKLIYLDMSHNHLVWLPSWFFACTDKQPNRLAYSRATTSDHQAVPFRCRSVTPDSRARCIQFAPQLTHFMLSHNQLYKLPGDVWSSRNLRFLDLSWNLLNSLPLPDEMQDACFTEESAYRAQSSLSVSLTNLVSISL